MKNIYYLLLLVLFACSNEDSEIQTGGDNIFTESTPYQIAVVLELNKTSDSVLSFNSTYFLKYYNSNNEKADTMYFEPLKNDINPEKGMFYMWIQDIDQGSIGPFTKIIDTGIVFIEPINYDSIYEFRRYN
jgi:hypothetical protein